MTDIKTQLEILVSKIHANTRDDEVAHEMEDDLHRLALEHIAVHSIEPLIQEIAELALSTRYLPFSRWYA